MNLIKSATHAKDNDTQTPQIRKEMEVQRIMQRHFSFSDLESRLFFPSMFVVLFVVRFGSAELSN